MELIIQCSVLGAYLFAGKFTVQVCKYFNLNNIQSALLATLWPIAMVVVMAGFILAVADGAYVNRNKRKN